LIQRDPYLECGGDKMIFDDWKLNFTVKTGIILMNNSTTTLAPGAGAGAPGGTAVNNSGLGFTTPAPTASLKYDNWDAKGMYMEFTIGPTWTGTQIKYKF